MRAKRGHARVSFDEGAFKDDLHRVGANGRKVAVRTRHLYETLAQLRRCNAEGGDGTALPQCLKVYLPPPAGRFGMVLLLAVQQSGPRLRCVAFGLRHHPRDAHVPTVYQIAHRRLHSDIRPKPRRPRR